MLRSLKDIQNYTIAATDGEVGEVKDFYFDDNAWVVRYFVVEAGSWLSSKQVLISPIAVRHPDWSARRLPVALTQDQVRRSPDIDTQKPVSRQHEAQMLEYYGYANYWGGGGMWGEGLYPYAMVPGYAYAGAEQEDRERQAEADLRLQRMHQRGDDPHLRSCQAVTGYQVRATDGEVGAVTGFLVDDETWAVRYLVIDTGHWWAGHKVLVSPLWIEGVHWSDRAVAVELSREALKSAPAYDAGVAWTLEQDRQLFLHYARAGGPVGGLTPAPGR
jgi:hypothetical protein